MAETATLERIRGMQGEQKLRAMLLRAVEEHGLKHRSICDTLQGDLSCNCGATTLSQMMRSEAQRSS